MYDLLQTYIDSRQSTVPWLQVALRKDPSSAILKFQWKFCRRPFTRKEPRESTETNQSCSTWQQTSSENWFAACSTSPTEPDTDSEYSEVSASTPIESIFDGDSSVHSILL
ncbi:hypothetical protein SAY86_020701 [Trapa natans]|uniref:Uncharacterized protein n=1 Tax=Trapa natans TaxID=22666 RepID=A0AAN7M039_TRANT|nr:hypothetical protein SAY86_020701 [Trapa natans]